jgi:hypothetical protein
VPNETAVSCEEIGTGVVSDQEESPIAVNPAEILLWSPLLLAAIGEQPEVVGSVLRHATRRFPRRGPVD